MREEEERWDAHEMQGICFLKATALLTELIWESLSITCTVQVKISPLIIATWCKVNAGCSSSSELSHQWAAIGRDQTNKHNLLSARFLILKKTTTALPKAEQKAQPSTNQALEGGSCYLVMKDSGKTTNIMFLRIPNLPNSGCHLTPPITAEAILNRATVLFSFQSRDSLPSVWLGLHLNLHSSVLFALAWRHSSNKRR